MKFREIAFRISRNFSVNFAKFCEMKDMKSSRNFVNLTLKKCTENYIVFFTRSVLLSVLHKKFSSKPFLNVSCKKCIHFTKALIFYEVYKISWNGKFFCLISCFAKGKQNFVATLAEEVQYEVWVWVFGTVKSCIWEGWVFGSVYSGICEGWVSGSVQGGICEGWVSGSVESGICEGWVSGSV